MSVAKRLDVDDLDRPPMSDVRARWPQWGEVEPVLGLVDDPALLLKLMRCLEPSQRDEVLVAVVRLGVVETEATVALVWLLVPGASRLAPTGRRSVGRHRRAGRRRVLNPESAAGPRGCALSRPRSSSAPSGK